MGWGADGPQHSWLATCLPTADPGPGPRSAKTIVPDLIRGIPGIPHGEAGSIRISPELCDFSVKGCTLQAFRPF